MNPEHQNDICGWIDRTHPEQIGFLAELVKVPTDNPPGDCAQAAERAAALLAGMGFAVERDPVPPDPAAANGMKSATNLIVRKRFGDGPIIALNAHGDVVAPGEGWSFDPYGATIADGTMFGRGVAVSKSDFATYAFALRALIETAAPVGGTVELHFTYDEEAGGLIGPARLLALGLSKPDFAICAGFSYGITVAHNGCLHLEIEVRGRSAHAARPDTGADALEAANRILTALYALREGFGQIRSQVTGIDHPTLVVGLIEGGINTNVVPDQVRMRLDRRIIPEEDPAAVEAELERYIRTVGSELPGIAVTVRRVLLAAPFRPIAGQDRLVAAIQTHASEILGETIAASGVPLYTDARHYAAAGIPTILYGAGPRTLLEANGHRADEKLRLEDLRKATKIVALALGDLLTI